MLRKVIGFRTWYFKEKDLFHIFSPEKVLRSAIGNIRFTHYYLVFFIMRLHFKLWEL